MEFGRRAARDEIRVVVCAVHMTTVLREILQSHTSLELADAVQDYDRLEPALIRTGATAIILGAEVRDPIGRCQRLLERFPGLRILALFNGERGGVLLRAGKRPDEFFDMSVTDMVNSLTMKPSLEANRG